MYYLDEKQQNFSLLLPYDKNKTYLNQRLWVFKQKLYLIRTEKNLNTSIDCIYEINTQNKSIQLIIKTANPYNTRYYSFHEDLSGMLWIGTSRGAICFKDIYEWSLNAKYFFKENKISSIFNDQEGNYWFTDLQNGIKIIPEMKSIQFKKEFNQTQNFDITALKTLNDSIIVVGFYDGSVSQFNTRTNTFKPFIFSHKIAGITVKDIESNQDHLFISRGHFLQHNLKTQQNIMPTSFGNARDMTIVGDSLICVHPEYVCQFSITDIIHDKPLLYKKIMQTGGRKVIYEPSTGTLYFALNNGLYTYCKGVIDSILLSKEKIFVSAFASNGHSIWAATQTHGIIEIQNKKIIQTYLKPNDIEDITAKTLFADDNYVWACTNSNLIRLNLKNKNWSTYSLNIGINPKDVTTITKCGNNIFIGTRKSFNRIPYSFSPENQQKPQLFIEKITVNDTLEIQNPHFILDYQFSNLRIDFISFSYKSGKKFFYEYRLHGFDTTWIRTSYDIPFAQYSSLPPGNYTFEIRSVNESKNKSDVQKILFTVKKPLWQQEWFYLIASLLSIVFVILIFRYQIKKIRHQNEIEKKLIASQLSALKAQMNPHFMFNALNSIQALILEKDIINSNLYLGKFSHLLRNVLDASGKEFITLKEELDILTLYLDLEKLRLGTDFTFSIDVNEKIDEYNMKIPAMLLQPFIENALKHGLLHKKGEKKLEIHFQINNNYLECTITDNGIGRKKSQEIRNRSSKIHNSFATDATNKRIELFNLYNYPKYKLEIYDLFYENHSTGTKVIIKIPIK